MTYVVTEKCIRCKFMDCVEVCPVDCFYEGDNMLVIHPDECIDCGVCEPECPVDAIRPDTEPGLDQWLSLNAEYADKWPNITIKRDAPADAQGIRDGGRASSRNISPPSPARATSAVPTLTGSYRRAHLLAGERLTVPPRSGTLDPALQGAPSG